MKLKNILELLKITALPNVKKMWMTYLFPQRGKIFLGALLMVVASSMEAFSVKMLQPVFDEIFISKNKDVLTLVGLQIIGIFAVKGFAIYYQQVVMARVGLNMVKSLQVDLFSHMMTLDVEFYSKQNSGQLINYFIGDVNIARDAMLNGLTVLVKDSCTVVFLIVLMFIKSPEMAAVMFITFPIAFYPLIYYGKKVRNLTSTQQMSSGGLFGALAQSFQGIRIIKSYCLEKEEIKKIGQNANAIAEISLKMTKISARMSPMMEFMGGVAIAGTLSYGGWRIVNGKLTTGDFMVFLMAIVAAYKPLKGLANLSVRVQMGISALDRLFNLFHSFPKIKDSENAKPLELSKSLIEVKNLNFTYTGEKEVLKNVSVNFEPNKTTAIVGASGSGKSTLINLLLRFYDVEKGEILINGQNIKDVTIKSLRENIAFVSQDVVLFDDTIKNNIIFGKEGVSEEDVIKASMDAAAHRFIVEQEKGYDTMVGERGSNLSGGQKQMISIARAMLKDAPILLLDEATSALDSKSESMVQESLERLMQGRTTIVIAHRLSTIINADKICVFDDGKIVEMGSHKELLELDGYYAKLYNLQFKNH